MSKRQYHDGHPNCASKDDESGLTCFINHQKINNHSFCKTLCLRPKCTCTEMYYQSNTFMIIPQCMEKLVSTMFLMID